MDRRLLLTLLLATTCLSSFLDGGSKKDTGTCSSSGAEKKCGGVEEVAPKKKKREPLDISVMWKEPDRVARGHFYDNEKYDGKTAQAVLKKLEQKPRVLESRCSQVTGVCYEVVDRVRRDPQPGADNNPWEMIRQVQLKGQLDAHFGRMLLVKPEELNWKTYDTKQWEVNKYVVVDREIQSLIGGLTGSKAIPRFEANATRDYTILLVGLGTPIIPMFLEQYHWMDMVVVDREPLFEYFARKWFGLRKHPNLRMLSADPVSFMSFIVGQRHEFDAVIINECKDHADSRFCPADVYLERSTMDVIRNIVKEEVGMVGVNTRSTEKKHEKEVANAYEGAFPMCFDYPADHKHLTIDRYKSTICFNFDHPPFWLQSGESMNEFTVNTHHEWFFYV